MGLANDSITFPVHCPCVTMCGGFSTSDIGAAGSAGVFYTIVAKISAFTSIPSNGDVIETASGLRLTVIKTANFANREYIIDCRK